MTLRALRPFPCPAGPPIREPRYSVAEAAEKLKLKRKTLYAWISLRKIGVFRVGGRPQIPESEINRILEAGWAPAARIWEGQR